MANKKLDELESVYLLKTGDYIPVYDSSESGTEKLKKMSPHNFKFYQGDPYSIGISLVLYNGLATNLSNATGGPKVRVTVADLLISIKGGTAPFTYAISKTGSSWSSNLDPYLAYIEYGCPDLGIVSIYVRVTDSLAVIGQCSTYCSLLDDLTVCGT